MTTRTESPWGVCVDRSHQVWSTRLRRGCALALGATATLLQVILGLSATTLAGTSPASADILGVSSAVEDWICGIVSPSEPWEGLGDGPESLMSNLNLAHIKPGPLSVVDASEGTILKIPPTKLNGSDIPPTTMDQLPALPAGSYTLYEVAGLRGLSWWTIPMNLDGTRNCSLWNYLWSQTGNLIFTGNKTILQVVIAIKEAASSPDPLSFLYDTSGGVMTTVFTWVFVPIAMIMFMCTAIWLGIKAARSNTGIRSTVSVFGTALAITALAAFLYSVGSSGNSGFRSVARVADEALGAINNLAEVGMFNQLTGTTDACTLTEDSASAERGQRLTSCILADTLGYRPWAIGQFGGAGAHAMPIPEDWTVLLPSESGVIDIAALQGQKVLPCYVNFAACSDLRTYLIAQHGGVQVGGALTGLQGYLMCTKQLAGTIDVDMWGTIFGSLVGGPTVVLDYQVEDGSICSPMFRVFTTLASTQPEVAMAYTGNVGIARVSQAFSSLIGTLVAGVATLFIALVTMGWHAMTFCLYIVGAFKLAFAVYAGKMGMAKQWIDDVIYSWLARVAYGIVLNITILLITWMLTSTLSFGMRLVWLGVILVLFWKLIHKVQELIKPGASSIKTDPAQKVQELTHQAKRFLQTRKQTVAGDIKEDPTQPTRRKTLPEPKAGSRPKPASRPASNAVATKAAQSPNSGVRRRAASVSQPAGPATKTGGARPSGRPGPRRVVVQPVSRSHTKDGPTTRRETVPTAAAATTQRLDKTQPVSARPAAAELSGPGKHAAALPHRPTTQSRGAELPYRRRRALTAATDPSRVDMPPPTDAPPPIHPPSTAPDKPTRRRVVRDSDT